ncbi:MAG: mandelate racemase/muconate lactonizing enzyme family protein [Pseudomonadota bacterium]
MKITALKTRLVNVPLDKPVKTAIHDISSVGCVLLYLETDQGLCGESYLFTINGARLKSFDEMLKQFAYLVVDKDPHYISEIWSSIWTVINPIGHEGVTVSALSAIDVACWDLIGKSAKKPLHQIFGACRDKIPTYASGGLWLSQSIPELEIEATGFVKDGFRAMKARVGKPTISEDVDRINAIREAVGPEIKILTDANQSLTPKHAIRLGRELEKLDVEWLEEPVTRQDLAGQADVRNSLAIPVASGETEWSRFGILATIQARAADVLMPDLQRIGGYTEMRRVSALAEAFNIPISTHIFTEQSLCIAGSSPGCISVEHMPWYSPLFVEDMHIEDGDILIPDRPGTGFTFSEEAVRQFSYDP